MSTPRRSKSTPCVGICSTTYGDLICRGCKRFAHEIVAWNGYEVDQKERVWARLNGLRDQVVSQVVMVSSEPTFHAYLGTLGELKDGNRDQAAPGVLYQVLGRLVADDAWLSLAGLAFTESTQDAQALDVIKRIDAEIYSRSIAHYERSFRVTS